jgi:RNA 3'-terminal phosphate cyclase (ATP)
MLTIDGSMGEGGGQVLRTSLAFSLLGGAPFCITNIRAARARPGLMRQHLVAVRAAAEISDATVSGAELGSRELVFRPKGVRAGDYTFSIGGAGSTTLVFQTVLYPLLLGASSPSTVTLEGGTHNPMAPPVTFLETTFLPLLARMGARVDVAFERYGFYPAGGGRWKATIFPASSLQRLELLERGKLLGRSARAVVAQIPGAVAIRELDTLARALDWDRAWCRPTSVDNAHGPGNALHAFVESEHVTEVFTAFGERGVRAEAVAASLANEVSRYLSSDVPVGEHLADKLLLPMVLGSGGVFRTLSPSLHCRTQMDLARLFLDVVITEAEERDDVFRIVVPTRDERRVS